MQKELTIKLLPEESADNAIVRKKIAAALGCSPAKLSGYHVVKRSIDARTAPIRINLVVRAFVNEPFKTPVNQQITFKDVTSAPKKVVIIGSGPCGLFAALRCLEDGIKPIVIERGKDVRSRRRDLALLNREGIVNPDSNYCFGEGGAGTYSDGKLYTRSNKRGDIKRILSLFVQFGANEQILSDAHPHIGTNKLPGIISAMREKIIACGGEVHFNTRVTDFNIKDNRVESVRTQDGEIAADAFILATGHSARDIFTMLHAKGISIEAKPFALGVRVEHPQSLIDQIQYHIPSRPEALPPASYSVVHQVNEKGFFSFCMCPGGIIATASTSPGELVVNGWSPSGRNNPFANSGMVVEVTFQDALNTLGKETSTDDPFIFMKFQQLVETAAFRAGEGRFVAPAQRLADFSNDKISGDLPDCSYIPGIHSQKLSEVLPPFVYRTLASGFKMAGKKMKGYFTNDAVVVATESRTSSPVRIPRHPGNLTHPMLDNLYPAGEGAGYAGGIVSAAMDGERVVGCIVQKLGGPL